jgi:hypothetical protein
MQLDEKHHQHQTVRRRRVSLHAECHPKVNRAMGLAPVTGGLCVALEQLSASGRAQGVQHPLNLRRHGVAAPAEAEASVLYQRTAFRPKVRLLVQPSYDGSAGSGFVTRVVFVSAVATQGCGWEERSD